jgi:hypothetical protein
MWGLCCEHLLLLWDPAEGREETVGCLPSFCTSLCSCLCETLCPWLASNQWNMAKVMGCHSCLFCYIRLHLGRLERLSFPAYWRKQIVGDCHMVGKLGKLPESKNGLQPIASKKPGPSAIQLQGNEFCQLPEWTWNWTLPQPSLQIRMQSSPHLDCSLVKPGHRTQLSCAWTPVPMERKDTKYVSFKAAKLWQFIVQHRKLVQYPFPTLERLLTIVLIFSVHFHFHFALFLVY